ncbi:MAG: sterol desaturase family protein [Gammaproteobacteria bacterium]|nr:sterol desaturase family protein [Gammaproteobacteria bacterium]MBU0826991.1 sterol desaturase family protein [Gammaproteobacteria bacterium]MBU0893155.1 sterol desaturase family protein [Gammaproteobacteria bacterium]MBU1818039.1 sterol desaturase family protein [Gammaproteobacteria bacterium]
MDDIVLNDLAGSDLKLWLGALIVALLGIAAVEGIVMSRRAPGGYDWRAFAVSIADALGRRLTEAVSSGLGLMLAIPLISWVYEHRLFTITLDTWWAFALLFVGQEFCYYWYHRSGHRVRWFWATHAVHHTPNQLTLATALRLGWTGKITGTALFFSPLLWLGFSPMAVTLATTFNLIYQFWLHTTWIPKLGKTFERWFNTPSNHRVHHGSNPEYLDCNYGGILMVFDRLFGTYVEERADVPPRYGLTTPLLTYNPFRIAFHEWINLARDLCEARTARDIWRALFAPPGARKGAMNSQGSSRERPGLDAHRPRAQ